MRSALRLSAYLPRCAWRRHSVSRHRVTRGVLRRLIPTPPEEAGDAPPGPLRPRPECRAGGVAKRRPGTRTEAQGGGMAGPASWGGWDGL